MNRATQHAFEPEEVMAYLDGELEPRRAAALAGHLEHCDQCRALSAQLRQLSERLLNFEVDSFSAALDSAVLGAVGAAEHSQETRGKDAEGKRVRKWRLAIRRPYAWAAACLATLALALVIYLGLPLPRPEPLSVAEKSENYLAPPTQQSLPANKLGSAVLFKPKAGLTLEQGVGGGAIEAPQSAGPMITQTASLTIIVSNYDEASASLSHLAAIEGGYVQKLDAEATPDAPRQVSATLRVPAKQVGSFLAELRKLGRVQQESQANEEITDQYVDLQARLKSARASEQRMLQLLATRTGKLEDVLDAERELARIRGEIESMEGQRNLLVHRVDYATVEVQLREEYRKQLGSERPSTVNSIRNAAVEGFGNFEDGVIGVLIFLLDYGLSILFWLALFAVPSWLIWRRFRSHRSAGQ